MYFKTESHCSLLIFASSSSDQAAQRCSVVADTLNKKILYIFDIAPLTDGFINNILSIMVISGILREPGKCL